MRDRAEVVDFALSDRVDVALEARSRAGDDQSRLACEALGAAIDEHLQRLRLDAVLFVVLCEGVDQAVEPAPGLDIVQTRDEDLELFIEAALEVLDFPDVTV